MLFRSAGLIADGVTEITNLQYIDRGYENFESKLRALGGQITRRKINQDAPDTAAAINE